MCRAFGDGVAVLCRVTEAPGSEPYIYTTLVRVNFL